MKKCFKLFVGDLVFGMFERWRFHRVYTSLSAAKRAAERLECGCSCLIDVWSVQENRCLYSWLYDSGKWSREVAV